MSLQQSNVLGGGYGGTGYFSDGAVGAPSVTFASDSNTGMYRISSDVLGFAAGGSLISFQNTSGVIGGADATGCFYLPRAAGAVGAPAYSFNGDIDTGMFRGAADTLHFATGGASALIMDTANVYGGSSTTGSFAMPRTAGTVSFPAYSFVGDADTGMYRGAADDLRFATGGALGLTIAGQYTRVAANTAITAGGVAGAALLLGSTNLLGIYFGSGAPTITAPQGSVYFRSDGSTTTTRLYVNTDSATTWTGVTTAA